MPKKVAIILLNWNTYEYTSSCISSVMKYCNGTDYDLIIADNGSTDDSLAILKKRFPSLIYIDNKTNLGFAEGNNKALEYSIQEGYTFSLLLNNDTETDEDFLSPLISHLEKNHQTVAVQPAIYYLADKTRLWNGGSFFNQVFGFTYSKNQQKRRQLQLPEKVEWLTGCCFLVRNSALKQYGLFNNRFFLYYEDVDLSFRLKQAGNLDYFPLSKIYHEAGVSGKQKKNSEGILSPIIHYYVSRNKIWFLRRYANPFFYLLNFAYNAPYYIALYIYFLIRRRKKKAQFLFKGVREGLFTPLNQVWV
ncbi:glycosyltransferase family 2 protein [Pedobacter aquatilis]|uniref:glycosyltransferase family 2 protein n=1 Tax=Pedobacter aquatilis TaxID=351343 RepID=UPI00292FF1BB|nr:glycosyltransferase family 2 protein [Pedobacter aquatilis]